MKKVYLMGIGGSGMASLAGLFHQKGWQVSGSDRSEIYPPASTLLDHIKATFHTPFDAKRVSDDCDLAVIGNIVAEGNEEFERIKALGIPYLSMAAAIREHFLPQYQPIVVTGTHGKTTTSTLLAFLLERLGAEPGYFIGGKPLQLERGYAMGKPPYFVLEGDEYHSACFEREAKFLHYAAKYVIANNLEFDHGDVYRDLSEISYAFEKLFMAVPSDGLILINGDDANLTKIKNQVSARMISFGSNPHTNDWAFHTYIQSDINACQAEIFYRGKAEATLHMQMNGLHNMRNALACYALLRELDFASKNILDALAEFKGVKKRQELKGTVDEITVYEDFAHHPTAVFETSRALKRSVGAGGRLWLIFEPRSSTSRRRIFQKEWVEAFSEGDIIVLAPLFNKPGQTLDDALNLEQLTNDLKAQGKTVHLAANADDIEAFVLEACSPADTLLFMSSGDFDQLPVRVLQKLPERRTRESSATA